MAAAAPESLIFVGGAPRSGTTVGHALICTADGVSRYNPEISFFRGFLSAYRNGKAAWDGHTSSFFADRAAFRQLIVETTDLALGRIWEALDRPLILALKDPHLTPFFPDLHELYPAARFVTLCRHPFDVVRSRQAVHEKTPDARAFGRDDVTAVAREYLAYYRTVLQTDFGGRHAILRYEDLNDETARRNLAGFLGLDGFHVERLWGQASVHAEDDAWGSPKYNQPIDLERRLEPLASEWAEITAAICGPVMQRLGYTAP